VRLATEGRIRRIEIDTSHFKGNHPDTCSIEGSCDGERWDDLLPRTKLQPHTRHFFIDELLCGGPFTHLRLNVYPDGGVGRLRAWGVATAGGRRAAAVRHLNTLLDPSALRRVCAADRWVETLAKARPFGSWEEMTGAAARIWRALAPADRLEAFAAHPRIGERKGGWSAGEQAGTDGAAELTMRRIAEVNRAYEEKFGFVFLVCATGRTAEEILAAAQARLGNDPETELEIATAEQERITELRLEKLVMS
jgi:allantoicase